MHGLVVRPLGDLDERHGDGVERIGDVGDERAVLARAAGLAHVEAERRRLLVARRGAVTDGVGGVGDEGAAGEVGPLEHLHVALGHPAVVHRGDGRVGGIGDVDDLQAVAVGAGEGVLPAGDLAELDVGAVVADRAVARGVGQVLDIGQVVAVLTRLLGLRDGGEQAHAQGQDEEESKCAAAHGGVS